MNATNAKLLRRALFCCSAAMGTGASLSVAAQERNMEEVVVTAQRRTELLEEVPMSVTVVNTEALEKANIVSFQDIGRIAVGTQINFSGAFLQPAIRGISTLTNGNFVENNVSIFVDGFYDPSSVTINADLVNVADVQVLKGPQGALYGRNATGGAILINTLGPTETFAAGVDATYGRFDNMIFNGHFSGPINDRLRYSVAGYYRDNPGYMKKVSPTTVGQYVGDTGQIRMDAVRAKLEADITDDLTATLGYSYGYNRDDRVSLYSTYDHVNLLPPPPARPTSLGTVAFNYEPKQLARKNQGTLKLAWNTDVGTLTSYTGYAESVNKNEFDFDGSYADLTYTRIDFTQKTFQQSIDYAIKPTDKLDVVLGGIYYSDELENTPGKGAPTVYGPNQAVVSIGESRQETEAWALFVDATYQVTDRLSLNAGGRYSDDFKSIKSRTLSATGVVSFPAADEHTWTKFTPRVTARYELAPRTNLYASFSKGFRVGNYGGAGASVGLPTTPSKPENIDAYEIGFKTARPGLRFETAVFYYDYTDLNVVQLVPVPNCPSGPGLCGVAGIFGNAPKAEVLGLDAEVTLALLDNLNIRAGVSLLDAKYKDYPNATGTGVNATNTANVSNQIQDWSDQQMARAPDYSGSVGIDYTLALSSFGSLLLATNVNFTDGYAINNPSLYGPLAPAGLQNEQRFRQKEHQLVSAQVTWTAPSENYYLQVFGTNLTDEVLRMNYNGGAFGDYGPMAEPLSYGVKVGVKF